MFPELGGYYYRRDTGQRIAPICRCFAGKQNTFAKRNLLNLLTVKVLALFVVIIFDIFVIAAIIFRMATERKHRILLNVL